MTKDEALELALEAFEGFIPYLPLKDEAQCNRYDQAITAIKEALAQPEQEPVAVYGYCPECGEKGVQRERRPNGNDKCVNGHTYSSSKSTLPQRTWVGLMRGVRVEGDTLVITVKGGNDAARELCGALIEEMNK